MVDPIGLKPSAAIDRRLAPVANVVPVQAAQPAARASVERADPSTLKALAQPLDYKNEYAALISCLDFFGIEKFRTFVKKYKPIVKKYRERFPFETYKDVVTEKNATLIERIDVLVDDLNKKIRNVDTVDEDEFKNVLNELESIVNGEEFSLQ